MSLAPLALFAFNRPEHLRRTLAALARNDLASQTRLWVFCDGARHEADRGPVERVREIARTASGFERVEVVLRDRNLGLARSIADGVSMLCAAEGRVIVVEDDLDTSPGFLTFMNRALERYADEERVMQVSGYMYPVGLPEDHPAVLLPATSCWGWATWRRAWSAFSHDLPGIEAFRRDKTAVRRFNLDGHYDYMKMLEDHLRGRVNSWGVVWHYNVFSRGGLTLYPPRTLVSNRGFDGSGTHGGSGELGSEPVFALAGPIRWPESIEVDEGVYASVKRVIRGSKKGVRHWLGKLLPA